MSRYLNKQRRGLSVKKNQTFEQWLRSGARLLWSQHPARQELIMSVRKKVNGKFCVPCNICGENFPIHSKPRGFEINHKVACGKAGEKGYLDRMLLVTVDDLEILCKPCHGIVTYSEKYNMSFKEAELEKRVIAFGALPASEQKVWAEGVNRVERMEFMRALLKSGLEPRKIK